jgi:hypothetical protein
MIPKRVRVAGHWIKVRWDDLGGVFGQYDQDKMEIVLSNNIKGDPDTAWETLYHEMMHASLGLSGLAEILGETTEEAIVRNVEYIFLPAISELSDS